MKDPTKILTTAINEVLLSKRFPWVDIAKGIAISLVVFRHVLIGLKLAGVIIPTSLYFLEDLGLTFRMPLFFLLSGFFFSKSISKRGDWGYAKFKFNTIMYPYFIWSIIQMSLQILLENYTNAPFNSFSDYIRILYMPIAQFWFLYALFNVSIIYLVGLNIFKNRWLMVVLGLILFFTEPYFNPPRIINDVMRLFIFYVIGDLTTNHFLKDDTRVNLIKPFNLIVLITLAFFGEFLIVGIGIKSVLILLVFSMIGGVLTIAVSYYMQVHPSFISKTLRMIGYHSLYIFMLHAMVSAAFRVIMVNVFNYNHYLTLLIAGTIIGIFAPIIIKIMSDKIGFWFLFTPYNKKR